MKIADDIAGLLGRFGASATGYLEVDHRPDYKEPPPAAATPPAATLETHAAPVQAEPAAPVPPAEKVVPTPLSVAVNNTRPAKAERVEPRIDDASRPAAAEPVQSPTASVAPSMLRSLLMEAALARQVAARAHEEAAAAHQSLADGLSLFTPARVVAVVSMKGGVGKTTICAALAGALNCDGRALAIDLDPQDALRHHLGVESEPDAEAAADAGLAGKDWDASLRVGAGGTRVLPYGAMPVQARRALERRLEEEPQWLARQLARMNLNADDVVLLDTPPGHTSYLEQALDAADQAIAVITPDAASFMVLEQIERLFEGRPGCSYVVNQFDASRTFCQDMLEVLKQRLGARLLGVVPLDHAVSEGLAFGDYPLLEDGDSPARQEILAIGDAVAAHLQAPTLAGRRSS